VTLDGRDVRDVAIVGAGPAGACLAARLARAGIDVVVLERAPSWHWRAGGVFASPVAMPALARTGLDSETRGRVARPIPAMRLTTPGGTVVELTYGDDPTRPALGFDRSALDPALVALATAAGADVRPGLGVRGVRLGSGDEPASLDLAGDAPAVRARVVVGADGTHSVVARAADAHRSVRLAQRVGLSYHLHDGRGDRPVDARLQVIHDGYVGIAPVPGDRVNVGIVLGGSWRPALRASGARAVATDILRRIPPTPDDPMPWQASVDRPADDLAGAVPLGVRATRRAGPGWFLVGDAAGFLDPLSGEGLHRALVSAELAAPAIEATVRGRATSGRAAAAYDRAMRRRFATKDGVSWLLQAFLSRPALLEYAARRLATRPDARATMGLVMGDLIPARRGLDPRFLAAVLAP
jgi:flavin-dependent dehydrogenase